MFNKLKDIEEILNNIEDEQTKSEIIKQIEHYQDKTKSQIEYLGGGKNCKVFTIGNNIFKFGADKRYEYIPFCLSDMLKIEYNDHYAMRVVFRIETGDITESDLQYVYNKLRDRGYVWYNPKIQNVGRIPSSYTSKKNLRIIDDVDIIKETEIQESNVIEALAKTDIGKLYYEIEYQKNKNPKFKVKELDQYFKDYNFNENTRQLVKKYIRDYKKICKEHQVKNKKEKSLVLLDNKFAKIKGFILKKLNFITNNKGKKQKTTNDHNLDMHSSNDFQKRISDMSLYNNKTNDKSSFINKKKETNDKSDLFSNRNY